jgi:tetratricopeptide (TPR) repeat protein
MHSAHDTFAVGATHDSGADSLVGTPVGDATIDPKRYVITRELARGGMGRVSLAEDVVLGRTVAIKELLDPRGDLVARFRRELALTARLQHPAIVSIHDGGIWKTGELAYVMRYVTGASLESVIQRAKTLEDRMALLPHAFAVVDAIAYAHARDIIHRDLKPANILVGEFGETVVIDWGLAKDLHAPDPSQPPARGSVQNLTETQVGAVIGTPAYMPPEQAAGEMVDARADVYSLGAVLYHVLAGTGPHEGPSIEAVFMMILDGNIVPLSERVPGLPRDLLAIVAKAMARDRAKRYAHAGELAVDLKKFAAGQLVGAQRYTAWQLLGRWIGRHKTVVLATTAALAVTAAVGVASVTQVVHERARAVEAQREATSARHDAEDLMDFMLVDLRKGLQPIGKIDLLFGVASHARDYYDRRVVADHHHVLARTNLADVLFDQRDDRGALAEDLAALALAETVGLSNPHDPTWQRDAASAHRSIGNLETSLASLPAAEREYRAALELSRDPASLRGLARTLRLQGRYDEAAVEIHRAIDAAVAEAALAPEDSGRQREVMEDHLEHGHILSARGAHAAAVAEFRTALVLADRLAAASPDVTASEDQSIIHSSLGYELKQVKDRPAARIEMQAAAAIDDALVHHDPQNANWQRDLAISKNALAKLLLEDKDYPAALAIYRETLALHVRDAEADPSNATKQHDLAMAYYYVADVLEDSGDKRGSLAPYRQAYALTAALSKRDPSNARWREQAKELGDSVTELEKSLHAQR